MSADTTEDLAGALLRLVAESTGFDASLAATLRLACETAGWEYGEAWIPAREAALDAESDRGGDRLVAGPTHDPSDRFGAFTAVGDGLSFAPGEGLVGRAWETGEPTWSRALDEETFRRHEAAVAAGFDTAVAIPVVADRDTLAVLVFFATRERATDEAFVDAVASAVRALGRVYVRKRTRDAVEAERASLDALVDAIPVGVFVVDADGTIERVNQCAADLLDMDRSALLGRSVLGDDWQPRSLDAGDGRLFEQVVETGEPVVDRRVVLPTADGEVTVSASAAPLRDADGTLVAVIGTVVDAADRVDHERQLAESNQQLESFAAVLSHDIRSPLAVAAGFLDLARETGDPAHFEKVERGHQRIEELVDTLLVLARSGELTGVVESVSVAAVAEAAWETVEHNGTRLVVTDAGEVDADRVRLRQLFENLFRNVVSHAGEDVTVTVGPLDGAPGFYVADNGVGIPAEERAEVLRPGHRSRGGGIGLGLSIVAAIAEGHDWQVDVTEPASGGARFEFRTTAPG
jgi:PAS domain S-box-containing protein